MPRYPNMSKERYEFLMKDENASLTDEEINAGWHFCYDWDFLLIHKTDAEAKSCTCLRVPL